MCACLIIISSIHFPWCIIYMFSLFPATVQFTSGYIKIYQDIYQRTSRYPKSLPPISVAISLGKFQEPWQPGLYCGQSSWKVRDPSVLAHFLGDETWQAGKSQQKYEVSLGKPLESMQDSFIRNVWRISSLSCSFPFDGRLAMRMSCRCHVCVMLYPVETYTRHHDHGWNVVKPTTTPTIWG